MLPEIERFKKWLRRKAPHASTPSTTSTTWNCSSPGSASPSTKSTCKDVDRFIEYSQAQGHAIATINRRLAALRSFYHFLAVEVEDPPRNPVIPRRHFIRQGQRLPRDIQDPDLEKLFAVITGPRDRAMFLLMLRCGLRVGEVRNLSLGDLYLEPAFGSLPRLWLHGKGGGPARGLSLFSATGCTPDLARNPSTGQGRSRFPQPFRQAPERDRHPETPGGLLPQSRTVGHLPPTSPHLRPPSHRSPGAGHHHPDACSAMPACALRRSICTFPTASFRRIMRPPCRKCCAGCPWKKVQYERPTPQAPSVPSGYAAKRPGCHTV